MPSIIARMPSNGNVKKALLIGIEYSSTLAKTDRRLELKGAHKDPMALRKLLKDKFGYEEQDIRILIDDDGYEWPTRETILQAMRDLVKDAQPGDHFVFSFSGHGGQVVNEDGTEEDGFDETLVPVDSEVNPETGNFENFIKDDDVRKILVNGLPSGAHLVMIFDCCHSGTASDLDNVFTDGLGSPASPLTSYSPRLPWKSHVPSIDADHITFGNAIEREPMAFAWMKPGHRRQRSYTAPPESPGPYVTSWSACMDSQNTFGGKRGGFFIKAFTDALRRNPHQSHGELLQSIRTELAKRVADHNMKHRKEQRMKGLSYVSQEEDAVSPRAQLGSLRPISNLHTPFTL
ncbi:peptidase C14 [Cubamyces lactineus]|nr:peptidase C14 [Cubamyces lactineus]